MNAKIIMMNSIMEWLAVIEIKIEKNDYSLLYYY